MHKYGKSVQILSFYLLNKIIFMNEQQSDYLIAQAETNSANNRRPIFEDNTSLGAQIRAKRNNYFVGRQKQILNKEGKARPFSQAEISSINQSIFGSATKAAKIRMQQLEIINKYGTPAEIRLLQNNVDAAIKVKPLNHYYYAKHTKEIVAAQKTAADLITKTASDIENRKAAQQPTQCTPGVDTKSILDAAGQVLQETAGSVVDAVQNPERKQQEGGGTGSPAQGGGKGDDCNNLGGATTTQNDQLPSPNTPSAIVVNGKKETILPKELQILNQLKATPLYTKTMAETAKHFGPNSWAFKGLDTIGQKNTAEKIYVSQIAKSLFAVGFSINQVDVALLAVGIGRVDIRAKIMTAVGANLLKNTVKIDGQTIPSGVGVAKGAISPSGNTGIRVPVRIGR